MRNFSMALRKNLILRKPRSGCLEGRTGVKPVDNFVENPEWPVGL
jgi:hypothetical protein